MPQSNKLIKRGTLIIHHRDRNRWTFRQIGIYFGISAERARQCYYMAKVRLAKINRGNNL